MARWPAIFCAQSRNNCTTDGTSPSSVSIPFATSKSQGFTAALFVACRLAVARGVSLRPRFLGTVDVLEKLVCGFIGCPLVDFTRAAVAVGLAQGSYQDGSVSC